MTKYTAKTHNNEVAFNQVYGYSCMTKSLMTKYTAKAL